MIKRVFEKSILPLLFSMIILVQPAYSQNEKDKNPNPDIFLYENNFRDTSIQRFAKTNHLLLNRKLPVAGLANTLGFSALNPLIFKTETHQQFEYNYLLQPEITRNQPLLHDYNNSTIIGLFSKFSVSSTSIKKTYIGMGEYLLMGANLKWEPYSRLSVVAGGLFSRQYNYFTGSRSDVYGINTETRYNLTSKLQFNIYGQYVGSMGSGLFFGNVLFPNSNIGSSLLFKVKNQTQIDLGVKYQYYENKKSWDMVSASKISVGF